MSAILIDRVQSAPFSDGDTYIYVRGVIICDSPADLPARDYFTNYYLTQGSTAHVISNACDYQMQSDGTWVLQQTTDIQSLVNQLSVLSGEVSGVESQLDSVILRITVLETATALLIDNGCKNLLPFEMPTSAVLTLTDNGNGTFSASGTVPAGQTVSLLLGRIYNRGGESLMLTGCPAGGSGSSGYSLLIADMGGSLVGYDEGEGYTFTRPGTESYFRVYARFRAGTYSTLTFSPMVTFEEYMQYTTKFIPYSPSNVELYRIIKQYHP